MAAAAQTGPQASSDRTADNIAFDAVLQHVLEVGKKNLATEIARLQGLGIIDENGNLLKTDLPADMQPGAERDFGG